MCSALADVRYGPKADVALRHSALGQIGCITSGYAFSQQGTQHVVYELKVEYEYLVRGFDRLAR